LKGFFSYKETRSIERPDGRSRTCTSCGLYRNCHTPKMKPYGEFRKGILNIGEAPGDVEDRRGKPWQGRTGQLLQETYKRLGVDLFEDCLNINAVNCRPIDKQGKNRTPTGDEIAACRRIVLHTIQRYKPKVIMLLGGMAVQSIIGHRWRKDLGGIMKWRGWIIPDQDFKCWICPTFHPSYVYRADRREVDLVWQQDLERAFKLVDVSLPEYQEPDIEIIEDLGVLYNAQLIAIDFETTGLKPHAAGHRIVSCAVANGPDHAWVFIMPETRKARKPLTDILKDPLVQKIGHNIKYEEMWSTVRLHQPIQSWVWDAMLAAHVLDNRPGITSLKFQTYVNFGVADYESEVAEYLKSNEKSGNAFNKINELLKQPRGQESLLKYNGMDAVNTFRLAQLQQEKI